jgi:hypothetical protein
MLPTGRRVCGTFEHQTTEMQLQMRQSAEFTSQHHTIIIRLTSKTAPSKTIGGQGTCCIERVRIDQEGKNPAENEQRSGCPN